MSGSVRHLAPAVPNLACHHESERGGLREGHRYSQEGGIKGKQQEHKEEKEESISVGLMKNLKEEGKNWRKTIWREIREMK